MSPKQKPLVVIIEDDRSLAATLADQLLNAGLSTQVFHKGATALKFSPEGKLLLTLGKPGVQVASITKRPNGYVLAHVEGAQRPSINGVPLVTDTAPLSTSALTSE